MSRLTFIANRKEIFVDKIKTECTQCKDIIFYSFYKKIFIDDVNLEEYVNRKICKCGSNSFNYSFIIITKDLRVIRGKAQHTSPHLLPVGTKTVELNRDGSLKTIKIGVENE